MTRRERVYVAGHTGLVGGALVRRLRAAGFQHIVCRTRDQVDLTDRGSVLRLMQRERPDVVLLAAAKVGGIMANARMPADFIEANLAIGLNVITAARANGVKKLLNLGSSCIYPRDAPQPIREDDLLSGPLEATNRAYAIAKIAILELCEASNRQWGTNYLTVLPSNLYGPGDNFDPSTSHVLPALLRRFHEAKEEGADSVVVWGTGTPRRELLHVDDLADACALLMELPDPPERVNVGVGKDITIAELAEVIRHTVGFRGSIVFDPSRPDGTPRKLLDVSRMRAMGWEPRVPLAEGIASTYQWFLSNRASGGVGR